MANTVRVGTQITGVGKASSDLDRLRDKFDRLQKMGAKGFAAGVGAAATIKAFSLLDTAVSGFIGGIGDSINASRDLNESMSKSSVVFGRSAKDIAIFGDTAAEKMGLSKQAAIEAAASFGNLFVGLDLGQKKAAEMSKGIVSLAGDLASFNNLDPTEVLDKLRAGLSGEAEPLRRVGVFLTEAKVKAKAMELGLTGAHGELTEGAKVLARYQLILDETTTAQGDFARTADDLANKQRARSAELINKQAELGAAFEGTQLQITEWQLDFLYGLERVGGGVNDLGRGIDHFLDFVTPWDQGFSDAEKRADQFARLTTSNVERMADDTTTAVEGMRGDFRTVPVAMDKVADASGDMKRDVVTDMGKVEAAVESLTEVMSDSAQDMIDEFFDPLETRADIYDTRLELLASQDALRNAKKKQDWKQARDDIVQALDDEGSALADLGAQGKLTAKDVDKFEADVKASYKAIGKAVPAELQKIIDRLRIIAGYKNIPINIRVRTRGQLGGTHGGDRGELRYAEGGVVPGPRGMAREAIVHGGETVRTPEQEAALQSGGGTGSLVININPPATWTPAAARSFADTAGPAIYDYLYRRGAVSRA